MSFLLVLWLIAAPGDDTSFSATTFLQHVKVLADDAMKGRETGTPENDRAAAYIADCLRAAGVEPAGEAGGYYQPFQAMEGRQLAAGNELTLGGEPLQIQRDFLPLITAAPGDVSGHLVFAGYGIHAPELKYDDFAGLETKGKILLVLTGGPTGDLDHSPSPFAGDGAGAGHTSIRSKIAAAFAAGASAVLIVNDPRSCKDPAADQIAAELLQQGLVPSIPAVRVRLGAVAERLAKAGLDLAAYQDLLDRERKPRSRELSGMEVSLRLRTEPVYRTTRNVVGILRGKGAHADEAVVVGAHYDHIGVGKRFSAASEAASGQIHNGADDNASGVSALLEVASDLGKNAGKLDRSIVFVAFSGEEWGLLGSSHYVKNPVIPLAKTIAMINFDMVGRSKDGYLAVIGVGSSPGFRTLVDQVNEAAPTRFKITFDEGSIGNSDHQSFLSAGVPALFFFSGLHEDYHRPSDDTSKVNAEAGARIAALACDVLRKIESAPERPAFTPVKTAAMKVSDEVKKAAESANPHAGQTPTGSPYGPWFGSVPSFANDGTGVLFDDVRENSPAAKAGLRKGDKMVEFGGVPVRTLEDFTVLLRAHKIGDEVEVVVMRGEERVQAKVTLAKKP